MKTTSVQLTKRYKKLEKTLEETDALNRIINLFFISLYTEFSLTEIAELSQVSKATASKIVRNLAEEELVILINLGIVWRIKANVGNKSFIREKLIFNLTTLYRSGIIEFIEQLYNHPKAIVLFGSFRKGDDVLDSDIDFAVEVDNQKEIKPVYLLDLPTISKEDRKWIEDIQNTLKRKITIVPFNRNKTDLNLFNNIANGIVLSGFLEVKK